MQEIDTIRVDIDDGYISLAFLDPRGVEAFVNSGIALPMARQLSKDLQAAIAKLEAIEEGGDR